MKNKFGNVGCVVAACAVLASCGGGGGGGSADAATSSRLTFTPSSVQLVQTQGFAEQMEERVTISPEPSGTQFVAVLAADKPIVQTGQVSLIENADNSATVRMNTDSNLAAGTYDGQFTLHICRDAKCTDEVGLTGNVLPYSIKVLPRVQLDVSGGGASSNLGSPNSYLVDAGATVVVTSNTPVTWTKGSSISGTDLQVISSTPTRWEGTIVGGSGGFVGLLAASTEKPANNAGQVIFTIR